MKRNTLRMLSLLLTLVMLLGTVPFVGATTTAKASIVGNPGKVWANAAIDLELVPAEGYTISNAMWTTPAGDMRSGDNLPVVISAETVGTYSVTFKATNTAGSTDETLSTTIAMNTPAVQGTFAITGDATAVTDQEVQLSYRSNNDSAVTWSHNGNENATISTTGKFKASAPGEYIVTATATNDPSTTLDDVEATLAISVTDATYTVSMEKKTVTLGDKTAKMEYTIMKSGEVYTGSHTKTFTSSNTSIVAVNATTGALTAYKAGTTTVKLTVVIDGEQYTASAPVTVTDTGVIIMEQDGESFDEDSVKLEFEIPGLDDEDVDWTFEVTGLDKLDFAWSKNSKDEYEVEDDESIDVTLKALDGYGVAKIDVEADWGNDADEAASATFYIAMYDEIDIKVTVDEDVDDFAFDDDEVFSAVTVGNTKYNATQVKEATLVDLLDDDTADYVDLEETRRSSNKKVGEINYNGSGYEYEADKVNAYSVKNLKNLEFEVDDEGNYDIEYLQYQKISGYTDAFISGKGTLRIIVGEGNGEGDINYEVEAKKTLTFDEDDFNDFWEEYCEDEDIDNNDLDYVKFTGFTATKINGSLYTNNDKKSMTSSLKFYHKYDEDEDSTGYDLDDITYHTHATKGDYVDEIDFTCYGEKNGKSVSGTITVTVGKAEEEKPTATMNFVDMAGHWAYTYVEYVYTNNIMLGSKNAAGQDVFQPDNLLSRGMVATVLYRMAGSPAVTTASKFTDVKNTNDWYYNAVVWASNNNIVTGKPDGTFAPNANITRQDLALMLYRFAKYQGKTVTSTASLVSFTDNAMVGAYAADALKWAVGKGIINGSNGKLNPLGNATRGEAAAMLQRYLTNG